MASPDIRRALKELANALQAAILLAEHLQIVTTRDAAALVGSLRRVTDALERVRRAQ